MSLKKIFFLYVSYKMRLLLVQCKARGQCCCFSKQLFLGLLYDVMAEGKLKTRKLFQNRFLM